MKENYLLNWQQEPRNPPPSQEDSPHHSFPGGSIKCHHRHFSFRCRHSLNNEFRGANNSQHQQHYYCYPAQQKARRKNQSSQKFHKTPPSLFPVIRRLSTAIKKRRRKNVYTPKIDFHHDPTNFFSSRLLCQHSSSALTTITFAILLTFMTLISTCLRRSAVSAGPVHHQQQASERLPQIEPKKAIFRDNKEGASAYNFKDDSNHRKFDSQASNTKRKMVVVNDPNRVKNDSTAVNASFGQSRQQKSYGYEFLNKIVHSASDIEELWVQ